MVNTLPVLLRTNAALFAASVSNTFVSRMVCCITPPLALVRCQSASCSDRAWKIVVQMEEERRIIKSCHSSPHGGHFGRDKTYKKIASRFYWPEMAGEVREFIAAFDVCQKINDGGKLTKATAPLHPIQVDGGWINYTVIQVGNDLIGPLPETPRGNKYIVTLFDYFSEWPEAEPLPDRSARGVALFLYRIMCRYGCTKIVISDQGCEFVSQDLFAITKTKHKISTPYHTRTNGLVERFNQTIQRALVKLVKKEQDDWDQYIDGILFGYRAAVQKSTKKSPFEVMYLRQHILPIEMEFMPEGAEEDDEPDHDAFTNKMKDIKKDTYRQVHGNIQKAQKQQKENYDRKHAPSVKLKTGTLVLLRDSARDGRKGDKFQSRYLGPYEIIEELGKGVFRLRNPSTGLLLKKSVNACRLKPYRKKKQQSPLHLTNSSLFQTGSPNSSFTTIKPTRKQPQVVESDSEAEESNTDDSMPPLPLPMQSLNQLAHTRKSTGIRPRVLETDSEAEQPNADDSMSPLPPPMPSLNQIAHTGKSTGKRPRVLEPDSECEQPNADDSKPPLPSPMPSLNQLTPTGKFTRKQPENSKRNINVNN